MGFGKYFQENKGINLSSLTNQLKIIITQGLGIRVTPNETAASSFKIDLNAELEDLTNVNSTAVTNGAFLKSDGISDWNGADLSIDDIPEFNNTTDVANNVFIADGVGNYVLDSLKLGQLGNVTDNSTGTDELIISTDANVFETITLTDFEKKIATSRYILTDFIDQGVDAGSASTPTVIYNGQIDSGNIETNNGIEIETIFECVGSIALSTREVKIYVGGQQVGSASIEATTNSYLQVIAKVYFYTDTVEVIKYFSNYNVSGIPGYMNLNTPGRTVYTFTGMNIPVVVTGSSENDALNDIVLKTITIKLIK